MNIELTPLASQEIRQLLNEQPEGGKGLSLRVGVKGSGPQRDFTLDLTEPDDEHPLVAESQGIPISCREADRDGLEGMRIDFRDLGAVRGFVFQSPAPATSAAADRATNPGQAGPAERQVRQALHEVIDPEVGVNIVDLGLVYGIEINGAHVQITMTMTTPACPLSEQIKREINTRVFARCPDVEYVDVDIVWEPPWGPERMSDAAKQTLGWSR